MARSEAPPRVPATAHGSPTNAAHHGPVSLRAERVAFGYGAQPLLDRLSVELVPGELLGVLGPNGAGKSTLLRLLAGDLEPQSGTVRIGTQPLGRLGPLRQAQLRAVMPQHSPLRFALTGRQVVQLGRSPHHRTHSTADNARIADEAIALVGAETLAPRAYPTLSGGEQQRIQLARALAQIMPFAGRDARFLLLDEPTSSLDLAHQQAALTLARRTARQNVGVLAVLHDLNLAARYCDRVLVLEGGRAAACGTPAAVFDAGVIRRCFGIDVEVVPHPRADCPLIVATGPD